MMAMMAMMATTSIIYLLFSFYYTQSDAFVIHPPRQSFDSALNYDPFDYESAEAKLERMQNIRTLQKSFYRNETGISLPRHGVFESLPIWTDNYTELPGFQHAMKVADPELVNMVLKIVSAPRPWYFGHVYNEVGIDQNSIWHDEDDLVIGTLMQISDYQLEEEDGMIQIGVQALGRFCIVEDSPTIENTRSVELLPDAEIVEAHYDEAKETAANFDFALNQNAKGAACAGAIAEASEWHAYEFEPITLEQGNVEAVAELNSNIPTSDEASNIVHDAIEDYLSQSPDDMYEGTCILNFDDEDDDNANMKREDHFGLVDQSLELERDVWIQLDIFARLLRKVDPRTNTNMPVPSHLLALLPSEISKPWPKAFSLARFSKKMRNIYSLVERNRSKLLLGSKNLNTMEIVSEYPALRRSRRLSYTVWVLIEGLLEEYSELFMKEKMRSFSKQEVLEMTSISQRLYAATRKLGEINAVLEEALQQEESSS